MLKISENPPILHPDYGSIADITGTWRVAHTKARNEKALAWNLIQFDIPFFLPLREKLSVRKGRKFKSLLPLFSGYVFFSGDQDTRYQALTTNRIAQVIEVINQDAFIKEISQIHQALARGAPLDPHPYLKKGDRCRVISGPLIGMEGILLAKKKLTKLILQIDILGQAAAVEIHPDLLEPIP